VQRYFRPIENAQQFGFVSVKAFQQTVERSEAGSSFEKAIEAGLQGRLAVRLRVGAVGLEIGVKPPDQGANLFLGGAGRVGEGVELVDQPLGMNLIQSSG
jgi:hypothetical protein